MTQETLQKMLKRWGVWSRSRNDSPAWPKKSMTAVVMESSGHNSPRYFGPSVEKDSVSEYIQDQVEQLRKVLSSDVRALELKYIFGLSTRKAAQKLSVTHTTYCQLIIRAEGWLHGALSRDYEKMQ
ncbi:antiterminator Q family protein [Magnetococcales bacterium HHB-1]